MKNAKTCDYCGEPITGRNDKRYCSSSCKSHDFRERGGASTTVVIQNLAPTAAEPRAETNREVILPNWPATALPLPPAPPVKRLEEQIKDAVSAVTARREQETLDANYTRLIERFLEDESELMLVGALNTLKETAADLTSRYRHHPLVKQGDELHRRRLEDLYVVTEAVSEALADAANQPFWAEKRGGYQLPGKLKRKMRERLLG